MPPLVKLNCYVHVQQSKDIRREMKHLDLDRERASTGLIKFELIRWTFVVMCCIRVYMLCVYMIRLWCLKRSKFKLQTEPRRNIIAPVKCCNKLYVYFAYFLFGSFVFLVHHDRHDVQLTMHHLKSIKTKIIIFFYVKFSIWISETIKFTLRLNVRLDCGFL